MGVLDANEDRKCLDKKSRIIGRNFPSLFIVPVSPLFRVALNWPCTLEMAVGGQPCQPVPWAESPLASLLHAESLSSVTQWGCFHRYETHLSDKIFLKLSIMYFIPCNPIIQNFKYIVCTKEWLKDEDLKNKLSLASPSHFQELSWGSPRTEILSLTLSFSFTFSLFHSIFKRLVEFILKRIFKHCYKIYLWYKNHTITPETNTTL